MFTSINDIFNELESTLERRYRESREFEEAWNNTPEGKAAMERAKQQQIEREALKENEPEYEEELDEEDEEEDNDSED